MHYVHAVLYYVLFGFPVWSYLVAGAILGGQEAINRWQKVKAQTYPQLVGNVFALAQKTILARLPIVGQVIALIAMLQTPQPAPALAQSAEEKAVQK